MTQNVSHAKAMTKINLQTAEKTGLYIISYAKNVNQYI